VAISGVNAYSSWVSRVLIVDDELDIRETIAELLRLEGHETFEATDGEQALVRCRQLRPDLVLLDLMMPGMNGWDFRKAQLRDPSIAAIPVVVVSAVARSRDLPADGFLQKPFSLDDLLALVRRVARPGDGPLRHA
jgi:CheY-like chemotaxis protein